MKRISILVATVLTILLAVTLYAQEPQRFNRGIEILNGNLFIGLNGQICFEGATGNAFETCLTVTDPTADRTLTWPDSTGTAVLSGGSAPFLDDDAIFALGTGADQAMLNNSAGLSADTALDDVLIGTPVSEAIAANSLMIANKTANGDIAMYANDGGTSQQFLHFDADVSILELAGYGGGVMLALEINPPAPDLAGEMVHIWDGTGGAATCETNTRLCIETDDTAGNFINFLGTAGTQGLLFGDTGDPNVGQVTYAQATNDLRLTANTVDRVIYNGTVRTISDSSVDLFEVDVGTSLGVGGIIDFHVFAGDATDFQTITGFVTYTAVNKAGTLTLDVTYDTANESKSVSSGTLTLAFAIAEDNADKAMISVTGTGSLTESTYTMIYTVTPLSVGAVVINAA
ncbi:hypothetical protein LCGC14_0609820 [marine sediment metagenome]|uniref:Uncharacterized protein n=1 Tax=marine sediment metagenome TaxID=412755 RepID=A0A0F9TU95_9ZZZZ